MTLKEEIDEICTRVAQALHRAYQLGESDALERVVLAARSKTPEASTVADPPAGVMLVDALFGSGREPRRERKRRAPRGAVGALVDRVIATADGPTVAEIKDSATDDAERMIAASSIRAHLRAGRKAGRYVERHGRWYSTESLTKTEAADPAEGQAASHLWSNQEDHR